MPFITFPPSQTKITASPHFQANYLSTCSNPYPICFHFLSLLILLILIPILHALCIRDIDKVCWISAAHNTSVWWFFLFSFTSALRMAMLHWLHHLEGIIIVIYNAHSLAAIPPVSNIILDPLWLVLTSAHFPSPSLDLFMPRLP